MAIQTSTGVRLSISSGLPASYDLAGYGALNYVEIGEITNIPQFGAAFQTVTNSPLASGIVQKRKGFVDYGNPVIDMALDNGNSGQQMMRAACDGIRKNQAHAFKLTYGDGELRYWSARVFSFQEIPGSANQMVGATSTMGITRAILQIPRITLDLAFSDDVYSLNGEVKNFSDIITFSRSTTGTYINQSGVLATAAIDEPRLSYDPATGESLGLLIEGSSTNLLTYSEQFDNAAWSKVSGATVSPSTATAPDGTTTADSITFDALSTSRVEQSASVVAAQEYTFSCWIKSNDMSEIDFEVGIGGDKNTIQITNQWARYEVSAVATGASTFPQIQNNDATAGTVFVWGAQLEQKPYATSYIKTEASQVTRAADLASVDDLSAWYNQSGGSIYVDFRLGGLSGSSGQFFFSINAGSSSDRVNMFRASGGGIFASSYNGGTAIVEDLQYIATTNQTKGVLNINSTGAAVAGEYTSSTTSVSVMTGFDIGTAYNGSNAIDGHIKTISYFPAPLSQSEMELITL